MLRKRTLNQSIVGILLISVISFSIPLNVFAAAWDPYLQYIPSYTPVTKSHLRGTWISTVVNLDWPSAKQKTFQMMHSESKRLRKN